MGLLDQPYKVGYTAPTSCMINANDRQQHFVILDVETTGFSPEQGDEIIELAGQRIAGNTLLNSFQALVLPTRPSSAEAEAVHGITADLLQREGRGIQEVLEAFIPFIEGATLVGHNIPFDLSFLNAHLIKLGRSPLMHSVVDTCELARRHLILPRYTLENVARYLRVPQSQAHRAMADVETTREVFIKLMERELQKYGSRVR